MVKEVIRKNDLFIAKGLTIFGHNTINNEELIKYMSDYAVKIMGRKIG